MKGATPLEKRSWTSYSQAYLQHLTIRHYAIDTIEVRERHIGHFIVWVDEREFDDPRQITRPVLEAYQRYLHRHKQKNGRPLSIRTQHQYLSNLKSFFQWLARENHIRFNPANDLLFPKLPQKIPANILSVDEVKSLFATQDISTAKGLRNRAIMELLYCTGMRRKELSLLELNDINLSQLVVFIREGKGGSQRLVPISESVAIWVERYLVDARPLLMGDYTEVVFIDNLGHPVPKKFLSQMVGRALQGAGIRKEGGAHLLRHSCATHMLDNGADIRFIQALLGHKDIKSTQIYTNVAIRKLREVHQRTHPSG